MDKSKSKDNKEKMVYWTKIPDKSDLITDQIGYKVEKKKIIYKRIG
jgi:hypothetical protein